MASFVATMHEIDRYILISCTNSKGLCGIIKKTAVAFAEGSAWQREAQVHFTGTFPFFLPFGRCKNLHFPFLPQKTSVKKKRVCNDVLNTGKLLQL